MNFIIEPARIGARGVDTVIVIDSEDKVQKIVEAKIDFVVQYLGSVTRAAVETICGAGLAMMFVTYGSQFDGSKTVVQLRALNLPTGITVWLDVEAVEAMDPIQLRAKINAWAHMLRANGYIPGMYVGPGCPLTSLELYDLAVVRYWHCGAKIIDRNGQLAEPACGFSMIQLFPETTIGADESGAGGLLIDFDVVQKDFQGRLPVWLRAA